MKKKTRAKRKSKELLVTVTPIERAVVVRNQELTVYNQMKRKAIAGDFIRMGDRNYGTKQWWRKCAASFGLNLQIIRREKIISDTGYTWTYYVRVTMPDGRYAEAEGACSSNDKFFFGGAKYDPKNVQESDIIHTAQTAGYNRAISDLFGGDVSAEEMGLILGGAVNSVKNLKLERKVDDKEMESAVTEMKGIWEKLFKIDKTKYNKRTFGELWSRRHYTYDEIKKVTEELKEELQTLMDSAGLVQKDGVK